MRWYYASNTSWYVSRSVLGCINQQYPNEMHSVYWCQCDISMWISVLRVAIALAIVQLTKVFAINCVQFEPNPIFISEKNGKTSKKLTPQIAKITISLIFLNHWSLHTTTPLNIPMQALKTLMKDLNEKNGLWA